MKFLTRPLIFLTGVFVVLCAVRAQSGVAQSSGPQLHCRMLEDYEYNLGTRDIPYSPDRNSGLSDGNGAIVNEYNVVYNLNEMPAGYIIPLELKTFAMENKINGVVIVPDIQGERVMDVAKIKKTSDGKTVLVVSASIAGKPTTINRRLMGIQDIHDSQADELHDMVRVDKHDHGLGASIARTFQRGMDKVTGRTIGTEIDYHKIDMERAGPLSELFAEKQMTLRIRGSGPYDIELFDIGSAIHPINAPEANLVSQAVFADGNAHGAGMLFLSDRRALYECAEGR